MEMKKSKFIRLAYYEREGSPEGGGLVGVGFKPATVAHPLTAWPASLTENEEMGCRKLKNMGNSKREI